ncbi:hypothetical protein COY07_02385 [Candidatus Peregrinibacteria bacterium CG_4_10_14_0_2_um_filter_43_11]|nr:MAG: hypothetical protein COY07_02385 [Candidatus Peregrinibacteria bacterium CG_4_10_14_0_2_um_filter_43_11]
MPEQLEWKIPDNDFLTHRHAEATLSKVTLVTNCVDSTFPQFHYERYRATVFVKIDKQEEEDIFFEFCELGSSDVKMTRETLTTLLTGRGWPEFPFEHAIDLVRGKYNELLAIDVEKER